MESIEEKHIPGDFLDYENWVSDTIDEYEEYICMEAFDHHWKYEEVLKTTIQMHFQCNKEITEEDLEMWLGYEIQYDGQESLEDISVFKPKKDFDLLAHIAENGLTFNPEPVSPYNAIFHFSCRGQPFVVYLSVVAQWMIDFQKYLQHMVSQWYKIYAILHRVGNVV
jgi:hypothetical protein